MELELPLSSEGGQETSWQTTPLHGFDPYH